MSTKYVKKPIAIEAAQWFKNGDHPLDYSKSHEGFEDGVLRVFSPEERKARGWEGDIVRGYRTPSMDGQTPCQHCGKAMHDHGWIDTLEGGHVVCPGDYIITGIKGEKYPCKPDIFEATYEAASALSSFQDRVRAEKAALDDNLSRLTPFLESERFASLSSDEQGRMRRQHSIMMQYSEVLGERIAAFQ